MFFGAIGGNSPAVLSLIPSILQPTISEPEDSIIYPIEDRQGDFVTDPNNSNPFNLDDPEAIEKQVEYDPETGTYIVTETIGGVPYRYPTYLTFEEYWENRQNNMQNNYFNLKAEERSSGGILGGLGPDLPKILKEGFPGGNGEIDIRPTGSIDLFLGFQKQNIRNPSAIFRQNNRVTPDFDMDINVGVTGKIGDNLNLNLDYNTRSIFNFENQIKLEYTGEEDDIIQELRAGNVDFRTPSQLIPGYQNLFGLQSKLQFGRLTVNGIIAEQRTRRRGIQLDNGAQLQEFELTADEYDVDRHFFLAQYFRDNFEKALATLPYINSEIYITRVEVYVNDGRAVAENVERDVVAFADLAEANPFNANSTNPAMGATALLPSNESNDLYQKLENNSRSRELDQINDILQSSGGGFRMEDIRDFRKTSARKLSPDEYTYDPQLGFLSLNFALRANQILAVAFEYTTTNGGHYVVGEFAQDVSPVDLEGIAAGTLQQNEPRILFLKMLRSSQQFPRHPMWELMMKNIYALGAFNVEQQDFKLDILYESLGSKKNPGGDIRYIPEGEGVRGVQLIKLLGLDRLNSSGEPYSDGVFDFMPANNTFSVGQNQNNPLGLPSTLQSNRGRFGGGRNTRFGGNAFATGQNTTTYGTINPKNGRLIFPVLEPFGGHLREQFEESALANKYAYDEIYDSTRIVALEFPENNRFLLKGTFKSNISSEISLGAFNIPQGSVRVTAGGQVLREGEDYIVDYSLGRLSIINSAYVNAGVPINVSFEDQATFGVQRKTLLGARADYWINDDFGFGATVLKLSERPFTPKVNYGDTPISNTMVGLDMHYFKETPGLTRFIDKLPGISTKEPSSISLNAEVAALLPGHANAIGRDGNAYIDDFDGSTPEYDIRFPYTAWMLASTPRGVVDEEDGGELFPESNISDLPYGYNRAKLAWYQLDFVLQNPTDDITTPTAFNTENFYTRTYPENLLFDRDLFVQQQVNRTFDLAFYPDERGPYNYDVEPSGISAGIDENGRLNDPASRWGGIMRNSPFKNFEQTNVEFVEFWLLDPFIENKNNDGDLYLHLGNISEDVLKDSKQFYENSLPTADELPQLDETEWGEVSIVRPINFAFANEQADREAQDLGFDGLTDAREREKFSDYLAAINSVVNPTAAIEIVEDPSGDNYLHFRDASYNNFGPSGANLLERYKAFNNPQGNSPVQDFNEQDQNFTTSSTNFPEMEDYNQDKSLSDAESYFEYKIPLKPNMGANDIGKGFLADFRDVQIEVNGAQEDVRFLYFQIPIDNFTNKVGSINFRNIEGIRLMMTDFEAPVVARFARFDIVRNNWRKYDRIVREPGEYSPSEPDNVEDSFFNLGSVNIEENSQRSPIPYNLPPDINREILPVTGSQNQRQNEQSITIEVGDLGDGEGRGVYKRINMDMRQFGSLKMYLHAEELQNIDVCNSTHLEDEEIAAFIRIGDDFQNNYYEYEIPLTISPPLSDFAIPEDEDNPSSLYPRTLNWPAENEINVRIQDLVNAKIERNFAENTSYSKPYVKYDTIRVDSATNRVARITVVGSPDLGRSKQVMVGVRNPKQTFFNEDSDDGLPKCAEVWFNELRLSDFNQDPALAAITTLDIKLADLGNFTLSGNMHTAGFGTLEDRITDRRQDYLLAYDASTNLELGRFLPKSSGIRIPLYAGISQSVSTPKYDPYDTDVLLNQLVDSVAVNFGEDSAKVAKQVRKRYETTRSINVTNMRKERTNPEKKPMPWDVENLALTYAYTETEYRDHVIEKDLVKQHRGSIAYVYNARPKYIEPFKKTIKQKNKYLRLIRDFNINFIPNTITFQTDFNRRVGVLQLRPLAAETLKIDPAYDKAFSWDRQYGISYNPMKSITVDYNATHQSVIDENQIGNVAFSNLWNGTDSLLNPFFGSNLFFDPGTEYITPDDVGLSEFGSLNNWGRLKKYEQNVNINYNVPLDKFPLLSWMQLRTRYGSNYSWEGKPIILANTLGNAVKNNQNIQVNGEMNFTKIYSAFPFLKRLHGSPSSRKRPTRRPPKDEKKPDDENAKKKKTPRSGLSTFEKIFLKPLVSIKRVSVSYNERNTTEIPGFVPVPGFFGQGQNRLGTNFPGWDFILGHQPSLFGWMEWAAREGVVSPSEFLNEQLRQNVSRNLQIKANLEPYRDVKIDLNADLQYSLNHSELFKVSFGEEGDEAFRHLAKIDNGSYTISFLPIGTSFAGVDTQNISNNFRDFERFATTISRRWSELNPASDPNAQGQVVTKPSGGEPFEFQDGYGYQSQAVLVPAFLAAYGGKNPEKVNLNPFNLIPLPNWRVTFNGLSKIPAIQKIFNSISISHGYQSTFTLNNFQNNLEFDEQYYDPSIFIENTDPGVGGNSTGGVITEQFPVLSGLRDTTLTGNFTTFYRVPQAIISERFEPLISIDFATQNDLTGNFEWKRSRVLAMSFEDYQLAETKSTEFTIGIGYRVQGFILPFKWGGKKVTLENDLSVAFDFSFRDDLMSIVRLYQDIEQPARGMKSVKFSPSADYMVNDNIRIGLFYEYTRNEPATSESFPITNQRGGLRVNFTF